MNKQEKAGCNYRPLRRFGGSTGFDFSETGTCYNCGQLKNNHLVNRQQTLSTGAPSEALRCLFTLTMGAGGFTEINQ